VESLLGEDPEAAEAQRPNALELAFSSADADAGRRDYDGALRWLEVAEQLNVTVPPAYAEKRERWTRSLLSEQALAGTAPVLPTDPLA